MKEVVIGGRLQKRVISIIRRAKLGVVQRPRTRCIVKSVVCTTVSHYSFAYSQSHSPNKISSDTQEEWDVVLFQSNLSGTAKLGRVSHISGSHILIDILTEAEEGLWILSPEEPEQVAQDCIDKTIPHNYEQRMIADRVSNPHGEHAEETFSLLESLPAWVYRGEGSSH